MQGIGPPWRVNDRQVVKRIIDYRFVIDKLTFNGIHRPTRTSGLPTCGVCFRGAGRRPPRPSRQPAGTWRPWGATSPQPTGRRKPRTFPLQVLVTLVVNDLTIIYKFTISFINFWVTNSNLIFCLEKWLWLKYLINYANQGMEFQRSPFLAYLRKPCWRCSRSAGLVRPVPSGRTRQQLGKPPASLDIPGFLGPCGDELELWIDHSIHQKYRNDVHLITTNDRTNRQSTLIIIKISYSWMHPTFLFDHLLIGLFAYEASQVRRVVVQWDLILISCMENNS